MKFQNSSIHGFKVMLCIKKRDERTDGRKDGRTDRRMNNPEAICPSNFFEVGGIKIQDGRHGGHLENLFFASSPNPKCQLTRNLVRSIGVTYR